MSFRIGFIPQYSNITALLLNFLVTDEITKTIPGVMTAITQMSCLLIQVRLLQVVHKYAHMNPMRI